MNEEMKAKLVLRIAENALAEFNDFKAAQLQNSKEQIFQNYHSIRFYTEVYVYLHDCEYEDCLTVEQLQRMADEGTNLIALMYQFFNKREYTSVENWEKIDELLHEYLNETMN